MRPGERRAGPVSLCRRGRMDPRNSPRRRVRCVTGGEEGHGEGKHEYAGPEKGNRDTSTRSFRLVYASRLRGRGLPTEYVIDGVYCIRVKYQ